MSAYRLVGLGNSELVESLSDLVRRSNGLTGDLLAHLAELEERMLHLELGFSSAFAYCVQVLGMSEGAAGRRLTGARVCRRFPEAFALVARGDLHLSALCLLGPHLNPENASELFEVCRRKARRQIEEVLAARFPRPDVREQIRRLPVRTGMPLSLSEAQTSSASHTPERGETQQEAGARSAVNAQRKQAPSAETVESPDGLGPRAVGASGFGTAAPRRRELEALSVGRFGVHFTADAELRELIDRARELASHRLPKGDLSSLMKLALTTFVQQEEKRRFAVGGKRRKVAAGSRPGSSVAPTEAAGWREATGSREAMAETSAPRTGGVDTSSTPPGGVSPEIEQPHGADGLPRIGKRGRHVPAAVRRQVYERDQRRCSFVSDDGRRCEGRAFLELDHIEPWARLGAPVADNLRLRCRAHNGLHARNCFGAKHIAARVAARRRAARLRAARSDSG